MIFIFFIQHFVNFNHFKLRINLINEDYYFYQNFLLFVFLHCIIFQKFKSVNLVLNLLFNIFLIVKNYN